MIIVFLGHIFFLLPLFLHLSFFFFLVFLFGHNIFIIYGLQASLELL